MPATRQFSLTASAKLVVAHAYMYISARPGLQGRLTAILTTSRPLRKLCRRLLASVFPAPPEEPSAEASKVEQLSQYAQQIHADLMAVCAHRIHRDD